MTTNIFTFTVNFSVYLALKTNLVQLETGPAQQEGLGWSGPPKFLVELNSGLLRPTYEQSGIHTLSSSPGKMSQ